ncbi:hypothetical protein C2845_PM13G25010 [Panicum miliaceum]|uniref:FBD domain-containing protein n=1 Tax=Panicum miliaceum TaxID=4540 RepID=A0A3L6RHG2_PANMI|nr:hypothetical protein C2845_PM13G25010 [Panicum miliaceum]
MRCPRLRSLRAKVDYTVRASTGQPKCFCDALADKCSINGKITLETLEEVDITGFTGAAEEMQLVSLLFESSSSMKRMTLRGGTKRKPKTISLKRKRGEEGGGGDDADDTIVGEQLMKKIPSTDRGCWRFAK